MWLPSWDWLWDEDPAPVPAAYLAPTADQPRRMFVGGGRARAEHQTGDERVMPADRYFAMQRLTAKVSRQNCRCQDIPHGVCVSCEARAILKRWPIVERREQ